MAVASLDVKASSSFAKNALIALKNTKSKIIWEAIIMENKIYNDDVERIVNDPERVRAINAFHEKRAAKKQHKLMIDGLVYCALAFSFCLLEQFGWMFSAIATPLRVVCAVYALFCFGRWFENGKTWGWK